MVDSSLQPKEWQKECLILSKGFRSPFSSNTYIHLYITFGVLYDSAVEKHYNDLRPHISYRGKTTFLNMILGPYLV